MRAIALLSLVLVTASPALAADTWNPSARPADQRFTFMGRTVGDPLGKHLDDFREKGTGNSTCTPANGFGGILCRDRSLTLNGTTQQIGSLPVQGLEWLFVDGSLAGMTLYASAADFDQLTNMLVGKLGTPSIAARRGSVWTVPGGKLAATREGTGASGKATAMFFDGEAMALLAAREAHQGQRQKEEGRKAF